MAIWYISAVEGPDSAPVNEAPPAHAHHPDQYVTVLPQFAGCNEEAVSEFPLDLRMNISPTQQQYSNAEYLNACSGPDELMGNYCFTTCNYNIQC